MFWHLAQPCDTTVLVLRVSRKTHFDNPAIIDFILDKSASPEAGGVFVAPVGALTVDMKGEQLTDLAALKRAGIVAASDEGYPIQNSAMMQQAMEFCVQLDLPIMAHCEDQSLTKGASMNEGAVSGWDVSLTHSWERGRPAHMAEPERAGRPRSQDAR